MAQQASRTFRWVFGNGLKGTKARGPQPENMEELAGLELKVVEDILGSPH